MPFDFRSFQLAKDPEHPEQCQDAFQADGRRGIAAVADGVATAIFSGRWADLLARAVVDDPPDPRDAEAFAAWLQSRRRLWSEGIDTSSLAWFQKAKLPQGAFSTLLWVQVRPLDRPEEGAFGAWRLRGFAIGDSCLFHVRDGECLRSFPMTHSNQLEADPLVLGSLDLKRDRFIKFETLDALCYPGDLVVLCTDAVAAWAMQRQESGQTPDWAAYWGMSQDQWRAEVAALREQRAMRYDDATLLLLRVTEAKQAPRPIPCPRAPEDASAAPPGESEQDWVEKFQRAADATDAGVKKAVQSVESVLQNLFRRRK